MCRGRAARAPVARSRRTRRYGPAARAPVRAGADSRGCRRRPGLARLRRSRAELLGDECVLGVDPSREVRGSREVTAPRLLFELTAQLGESRRAEGGPVRLQRVRGAADFVRACPPEGREQGRSIGEEGLDEVGEELVSADLTQALKRGRIEDWVAFGSHAGSLNSYHAEG